MSPASPSYVHICREWQRARRTQIQPRGKFPLTPFWCLISQKFVSGNRFYRRALSGSFQMLRKDLLHTLQSRFLGNSNKGGWVFINGFNGTKHLCTKKHISDMFSVMNVPASSRSFLTFPTAQCHSALVRPHTIPSSKWRMPTVLHLQTNDLNTFPKYFSENVRGWTWTKQKSCKVITLSRVWFQLDSRRTTKKTMNIHENNF